MIGFWAGVRVKVVVCTGLTVVCACAALGTQTPSATTTEATESATPDARSRQTRTDGAACGAAAII